MIIEKNPTVHTFDGGTVTVYENTVDGYFRGDFSNGKHVVSYYSVGNESTRNSAMACFSHYCEKMINKFKTR